MGTADYPSLRSQNNERLHLRRGAWAHRPRSLPYLLPRHVKLTITDSTLTPVNISLFVAKMDLYLLCTKSIYRSSNN